MAKASLCMRSVLLDQSTTSTHFSLPKREGRGQHAQHPRLHTLASAHAALSVAGRRNASESLAPRSRRGFEPSASHRSSVGFECRSCQRCQSCQGCQSCRLTSRPLFPAGAAKAKAAISKAAKAQRGYLEKNHRGGGGNDEPPVDLSLSIAFPIPISIPIKRSRLITACAADSSTGTAGWPTPGSPAPGDGWPKVPPVGQIPITQTRGREPVPRDVASKAMMAFKKGLEKKDWKAYLDMMTDDVELWVPVDDFVGKPNKGKEAMKKFFDLADRTFSKLEMQIVNRSFSQELLLPSITNSNTSSTSSDVVDLTKRRASTSPSPSPSLPSAKGGDDDDDDGDGHGDGDGDADEMEKKVVKGTAMFEIRTDGNFASGLKYGNRIVVVVDVRGDQITAHREYFGLR